MTSTEIGLIFMIGMIVIYASIYFYYIKIKNINVMHVTLLRFKEDRKTIIDKKEIALTKDKEDNYVLQLPKDFPKLVCCHFYDTNYISLETSLEIDEKKSESYIMTKIGLLIIKNY
jgi:hypothetical protein